MRGNLADLAAIVNAPVVEAPPTRGMLRRARASWPFDWADIIAFAGLLMVGGSIALVWLPLAGIVVGGFLMVYALLAALPARAE